MPKITGADKAEQRIRDMASPDKIEQIGKALFAGGEIVKAKAARSITAGAVSGKNHVPSAPGEPPNEDTGTLRRNITVTQVGPLHVRIASNAPYSAFLEYGTSRMAARPFMGPAARASRKEIVKFVGGAVNIAIRRKR